MELRFQQAEHSIHIDPEGDAHYRLTIDDHRYTLQVHQVQYGPDRQPSAIVFSLDGQRYCAYVAADGQQRMVAFDAQVLTLTKEDHLHRKRVHAGHEHSLAATMPGQVIKILVSIGDAVKRGQPLVILEAMKMEIRVAAPHDGTVDRIECSVGQIVERGQPLIELGE